MVEGPLYDVGILSLALITLQGQWLKTEWLITSVTPSGSPGTAECDILRIILTFFGQFIGHSCDQEATL